ncbi:hypothetical protein [Methanopyrus kandleri]
MPIKVLVPSDAELVTAKWKPERGRGGRGRAGVGPDRDLAG